MLRVIGLQKSYGGTRIVNNLTLSVDKGEIVFLVGRSGCGKSTSLRLIANLETPDGGHIQLDGISCSEYGAPIWRTMVMYVPQSRNTLRGTPVDLFEKANNFASRSTRKVHIQRFFDVARRLGLDSTILKLQWSALSGGQNQRAAIALAITFQPKLLLLDEPTSACDAVSARLVEDTVCASGAAVLWVSHDVSQPARVGGRVFQL